jgi:transposase
MIYRSEMSRPSNHSISVVERAKAAADSATTLQELRLAQATLLPAVLGATIEQTAEMLGVGHATVSRLQAAFRKSEGEKPSANKSNWGGRRHYWMTLEEEKEFLAPWTQAAVNGSLVVVSPIRAALAQRLGQTVKASVVYRMLSRHGWRKVAPDTRHPKSDLAVQEAWKKNSLMSWKPS